MLGGWRGGNNNIYVSYCSDFNVASQRTSSRSVIFLQKEKQTNKKKTATTTDACMHILLFCRGEGILIEYHQYIQNKKHILQRTHFEKVKRHTNVPLRGDPTGKSNSCLKTLLSKK